MEPEQFKSLGRKFSRQARSKAAGVFIILMVKALRNVSVFKHSKGGKGVLMKLDSRHKGGVSLQGNIAAIELNHIFQFFHYATVSGELRVVTDDNNASFFFQKGILIFGALSVNQQKIGDLLLASGLITDRQLSECLKIHKQHGMRRRLGDIMVRKGFLQYTSLADLLKLQAREAFFETLSWKKGMFFFYVNHSPAQEEILINERIDHLLLEGIVRMDNSEPIAALNQF